MPKRVSNRSRRLAGELQKELADILANEMKDPRLGFVTLTGVEVSSDGTHARIFFVCADDGAKDDIARVLRGAGGFLRSELARRLNVRIIPELRFAYDQSIGEGMRMDRLIDEAVASDTARHHED